MTAGSVRAVLVALVLAGAPGPACAQVFLASEPNPRFTIGPLLIVGTVGPDLGPVGVRVSWSVMLPPGARSSGIGSALYLLWPGEVESATAPGPADAALRRHVEDRGFTVVASGRLALESRDRAKLGTQSDGTPVGDVASFVTFYKKGTNPVQSGIGTLIKVPWIPLLSDPASLTSVTMRIKDLITPKPATWLEETFWGRRYVFTLNAGSVGSLALYSLYFEERDRVVRLARDFSVLLALFTDADHLRVEEISPPVAARRPSRVRAGVETISVPIVSSEGAVAQTLKVQFAYFSGPIAWRPVLISLAFLILGNMMGAFMFAREVSAFIRRRFHVAARPGRRRRVSVPSADTLAYVVPGTTTYGDVLTLCGPPSEEQEWSQSPKSRTLIYRGTHRVPHYRFRFGRLATVSHWDEERHEVVIDLANDRVIDVVTQVRRARMA